MPNLFNSLRSVSRGVSDGALLFVVTTILFSFAGAVWGWFYPAMQFVVTPNRGLDMVTGTSDAGFRAFVIFLAATAVLGVVTALWAFRFLWRGVGQLVWTSACVAFGTWWFVFLGLQVVSVSVPDIDANSTHAGDIVEIASAVPLWPGILVAPTLALVVYWLAAVMSDESSFPQR